MLAARFNDRQINEVAELILGRLHTIEPPEFETPTFPHVNRAERANAVLFCSVCEVFIGQKLNGDRQAVQRAWRFFDRIARSHDRPLNPHALREYDKIATFGQRLVREEQGADAGLPVADAMVATLETTLADLRRYNFDASRLGRGTFGRHSARRIERQLLTHFEAYRHGDQAPQEANARVFIKVCTRANVWPHFKPGPFRYPYSRTIAVLLMNAECIRWAAKDEEFDEADKNFRRLVAGAEHRIVKRCIQRFRELAPSDRARIIEVRFPGRDVDSVSDFDLADVVDKWLWDHGSSFCRAFAGEQIGNPTASSSDASECDFGVVEPVGCYCRRTVTPCPIH